MEAYGNPVLAGNVAPGLITGVSGTFEVFEYKGLMRDEGFANSSATAGGVTLGAAEAVSLPSVVFNRLDSATSRHLFLAVYSANGDVREFKSISSAEFETLKTCRTGR